VESVDWNNSAPTTMSLYEYVEKNVPNSAIKGKITITENEEIIDIPTQNNKSEVEEKKTEEQEKTFLQNALKILGIII
jgi:hypothetical protein